MDSTSRRPQLPALSYLDVDKLKKEEDTYQDRNHSAPPKHGTAATASPPYHHSSGPPPPAYAHSTPYHSNTWQGANAGTHTPPASRRTSGEDYENGTQTIRQSLPSISEALGPGPLDNPASHAHPASTSQAPPPPAQLTPQSTAPRSPLSSARRSFPMEPPPPSQSQYSYYRQDSAGPNTFTSPDLVKPAYGSHSDGRHQTNGTTAPSSQPGSYASTHSTSPRFESRSTASSNSMPPPPPSSFSYGYSSYQSRSSQASSNGSAGPVYQPSTQYAPPGPATPSWKSQSTGPTRYTDERPAYGESVKRHLDMYDLEAALGDILSSSSIVSDFSRRYGDRTHQAARTGLSLSSLPSLVEVEDMINKSRHQIDSLARIRDLVIAQQAAYEQQLADQQQQRSKVQFAPEAPPPSATPAGHHLNDMHPSAAGASDGNDDMKGGFAAGETKKRRGRAAPPGRCHSCQRAETPEWRRGPDGARTLCNACGLHYAKLTRKQGSGGAKAGGTGVPVGNGGALRPKEG